MNFKAQLITDVQIVKSSSALELDGRIQASVHNKLKCPKFMLKEGWRKTAHGRRLGTQVTRPPVKCRLLQLKSLAHCFSVVLLMCLLLK